jgi:hypothetical protein
MLFFIFTCFFKLLFEVVIYKYFNENEINFDFGHYEHSFKGENTTLKYCVKIYFSKNTKDNLMDEVRMLLKLQKIDIYGGTLHEHPEKNHIWFKLYYRENIKRPYPYLKVYKK